MSPGSCHPRACARVWTTTVTSCGRCSIAASSWAAAASARAPSAPSPPRSSRSSSADRRSAWSACAALPGRARPRRARRSPGAGAAGPPPPGRPRPRPTGSPGGRRPCGSGRTSVRMPISRISGVRTASGVCASPRRRMSAGDLGGDHALQDGAHPDLVDRLVDAPPQRLVPGVLDQYRAAEVGGERVDRGLDDGRLGHWPPPREWARTAPDRDPTSVGNGAASSAPRPKLPGRPLAGVEMAE